VEAALWGKAASWGDQAAVDRETLPRLWGPDRGGLPRGFKALVVQVVGGPLGTPPRYRFWDWLGTSRDREDWWPASTVKVFAAVAALERLRAWGFSPAARVTFHYGTGDETRVVESLVRRALTASDNQAFDQLVEVVTGDGLNRWLQQRGFRDTVLLRGYSHRVMDPDLGVGVLRVSPPRTVWEGSRVREEPGCVGTIREGCRDLGNCTSLLDLCDLMRRVMIHRDLPEAERLALGPWEVALVRSALSRRRVRGLGVVRGLRQAFLPERIACFHKPGYAMDWFSDHVFLQRRRGPRDQRTWIVAMAGQGGRDALDEPARAIGGLIRSGALSAAGSWAPGRPPE